MKKIALIITLAFSCNVQRAEEILGPDAACTSVEGGARCVARGRVYYCVRSYGCGEMSCGVNGGPQ